MNVLFITSSRLGDAVLSTGLLDHIINTYPQARITVVCGRLPASLFEGMPGLERVIALEKKKLHGHWLDLWRKVGGTKWNMVVDLRNSAVSRLVRAGERHIYSRHIDDSLHKVEQCAAVMGLDVVPAPRIWISDKQQADAAALVPPDGPVLAVGPTANWIGKTWLSGCFIELIGILTGLDGILPEARVAVFAAQGEEVDAYKVLCSVTEDRRIDIIAKTDPGTAAAALSRCALYVGNDSGLMHCAAAAGIPVVGLFGPSYPHLYRPWGAHATYVRTPETYNELIAFEGYDPGTLDRSLMTSLSVEAVVTTVCESWKLRERVA